MNISNWPVLLISKSEKLALDSYCPTTVTMPIESTAQSLAKSSPKPPALSIQLQLPVESSWPRNISEPPALVSGSLLDINSPKKEPTTLMRSELSAQIEPWISIESAL